MVGSMLYSSSSPSIFRFFCCCNTRSLLLNTVVYPSSKSVSPTSEVRRRCKPIAHSFRNSLSGNKFAHRDDDGAEWRRTLHFFCRKASSSSESTSTSTQLMNGDGINVEDEIMKIKEVANTLDIRVGKIIKAWRHEEAESLYVEEVDVGETEPRIICSGLVEYIPLQDLQDSLVVVLTNLKPRNMRGVKSYGMLMAASDESHKNVELLLPPEGSVPGERIWFGTENGTEEDLPDVASPNQIQKKKIWEQVQPHLRTDASCVALLGPYTMQTSKDVVFCTSLKNAKIS